MGRHGVWLRLWFAITLGAAGINTAARAPEPELPPYDASKHEPIEKIPIEPEGEQTV
jgi:hypothetical protein